MVKDQSKSRKSSIEENKSNINTSNNDKSKTPKNQEEIEEDNEDDDEDNEEDSLIRLSQQAQRRKLSQQSRDFHEPGVLVDEFSGSENEDLRDNLELDSGLIVEEEHSDDNSHDSDDHDDEEENEYNDEDNDEDNDDIHEHDEDEDEEAINEEELEMIETADFLRHLMHARRRTDVITNSNESNSGNNNGEESQSNDTNNGNESSTRNHEEGGEDDMDEMEDFDPNDPRAEFLRAIGALPGARGEANGGAPGANGAGFVDVMQRLMGGGVMFGGNSGDHGEIEALINNLEQKDDTYIVLESLNELSERLLMMNGLTAERLIPANKLARSLVGIMEDPKLEDELELHLVACRCLYNFLEVNQDFIHDALNNNAIPALCNKLLEIKYIDLTEQALQTLEMISKDTISHNSIISNNGLTACLQYLDFLTVHAQRKCLSIVSNSCTNITMNNYPKVKEAFNSITEVVKTHNDQNVVENAWITISRIITCFKNKPEYLNEIFTGKELFFKELTNVILISCNKSSNTGLELEKVSVSYATCSSLIVSLIILSSVSIEVSKILLSDCDIGLIIVKSLNKFGRSKKEQTSSTNDGSHINIESLMAAPKELILLFITLIGNLLPIHYSASESLYLSSKFEEYDERKKINKDRIELCSNIIPQDYKKFINEIWSLLTLSFQATMDFEIRRSGFVDIYRIINSVDEQDLISLKDSDKVAVILASVVNQYQPMLLKDLQKHFEARNNDKRIKNGGGSSSSRDSEVSEDVDMLTSDIDDDNDTNDTHDNEKHNEGDVNMDDTDESDENDNDVNIDYEGEEYKGVDRFREEHEHDDDEDDEDEDDDEDEEEFYSAIEDGPRDLNKINSTLLILSALKIMNVLFKKAPTFYLQAFEREGLINDVKTIIQQFKPHKKSRKIHSSSNFDSPMRSSFGNKFIDLEFSKDYEYKTSLISTYYKIEQTGLDIVSKYKEIKLSEQNDVSEHMTILQNIKQVLSDPRETKLYTYDQWMEVWDKLKYALNGASNNSQVSSFELISSGLIDSLTNLFTSNDVDFSIETNLSYSTFVDSFFQNGFNDAKSLIQKLLETLTRSESFDIVSIGNNNNSNHSSNQSQTTLMANQIKLKLTAEGDMGDLNLPTIMKNMSLSVHAIATFKSILSYLKQRINFMETMSNIGLNKHENIDEKKNNEFNIEFLINGEVIPLETTIYGAIYRSIQTKPDEVVEPSKIWSSVHNVTFRKVCSEVSRDNLHNNYNFNFNEHELDVYDKTTISILKLLKVLFKMNVFIGSTGRKNIPVKDFTNWKLTVKLNRQLEEPLIVASGTLPGWSIHLTKQFPFIFPLETRIFFLQSTSFGYSRLIHQWQLRINQNYENDHNNRTNNNNHNSNNSNQRPQLGRPTRHKVRITRSMMLQSALKVLGIYGSTPGILEIEYFDEVGSGLGPTLEFYSTVSKEFCRSKLQLWRNNVQPIMSIKDEKKHNDEGYVDNSNGLFPQPMDREQLSSENGKKIIYIFASLGKFIARALLDSRIIDFNFNPIFLKLVQLLNLKSPHSHINQKFIKKFTTISNLKLVDPQLSKSLNHLNKYLIEFKSYMTEEECNSIEIDGATIKDLGLYFELPGYPEYNLINGGSNIPITANNLELYINKVLEATLYSGIIHQTKAFMEGFSKVFPINSLIIFSPNELVQLFGSNEEDWSIDTLSSAIIANHGYTRESKIIKDLISILVEFNDLEKREFLQFLTGSPKLPIGGFKALRPELTVVRKRAEDGLKDDDYLPSVMTCANYLKIPNYSSKEIMKEKILQAVKEGAGAFLLS
ncbi:UFD4 [Candida pseudojiufengensis]|uniref:UFD4 n=1 Tax=Candida pseudojiufengensis TaxID=497109 RepID=UPI002223F7E1|nr:UFD4 [Candida pseudojiufengensis]KAI5963633.1 UFD4 [Candida pseudojiufengensis]